MKRYKQSVKDKVTPSGPIFTSGEAEGNHMPEITQSRRSSTFRKRALFAIGTFAGEIVLAITFKTIANFSIASVQLTVTC